MIKPEKRLAGFLIAASLIVSGCSSGTVAEEVPEPEPSANVPVQATPVTTCDLQITTFPDLIATTGKVESLHDELFVSQSGGLLEWCIAQTGRQVQKDAVIARFSTEKIAMRLERAQLQQFNARKEYESQLLGYEQLLKGKSEEEARNIKEKLRISSGLAMAEQDIKEAKTELQQCVVKAPFAGIFADVQVQSGDVVKPGATLFRLYQPDKMLLSVKVLESDIHLIKPGMPATVTPVGSMQPLKASVYDINPYIDNDGMATVRLSIQHKTGDIKLYPGMNATAIIQSPAVKTLVVPKEAIVYRDGKPVVFTLENGRAKWNYVAVGRDNGKQTEIKEGLQPGMKVITSNNLQLAHDAPVEEILSSGTGKIDAH